MTPRFNMGKVQPAAYKAMDPLDNFVSGSALRRPDRELIRIRASQINGCAYCVHQHTQDALKLGVPVQKVNLICVWREAHNVFNEDERLLLEMTEEITLIHQHGLSERLYDQSMAAFGEVKTAQIIMAIITINAWNRIGIGLKMKPEVTL